MCFCLGELRAVLGSEGVSGDARRRITRRERGFVAPTHLNSRADHCIAFPRHEHRRDCFGLPNKWGSIQRFSVSRPFALQGLWYVIFRQRRYPITS